MSQIVEIDDKIESNTDEETKNDTPVHNGKPITIIELSPKEKYLVSYSQEDRSIIGWNIEKVNESQPKPEFFHDLSTTVHRGHIKCMSVSDDKKLVYSDNYFNKISK
jgi:hypothetical protein